MSGNICKFIDNIPSESLCMQNFVLESDACVMKNATKLNYHCLMLIKDGGAIFNIDGKEFTVQTGHLIFVFSGECLEISPDDGCEYMYISFSGGRSDSLFSRFCIDKSNRCFSGFDGIIPLWLESLGRANEKNIDLASESVLLYTLSRFTKEISVKDDLLNRILKLTEEQFSNSDLSITKIAEKLSYNPKYLSHLFKEKMGITYSMHLRNLRIKYAVSLLDHGIDSVKNIAYLSGFSDPLYFSSVFKSVVGVSPKEYKQS